MQYHCVRPLSSRSTISVRYVHCFLCLFLAQWVFGGLFVDNGASESEEVLVGKYQISTAVGNFSTDIYYPIGVSKVVASICFLQGGSVDKIYYSQFANSVASLGYIIAIPNAITRGTILPTPPVALIIHDTLQHESNRAGSPIHNLFSASTFALMGHSFGGAMALVASAVNAAELCNGSLSSLCHGFLGFSSSQLCATIGISTNLITGSTLIPVQTPGRMVALFEGTNDGRATPSTALATYKILGLPKAYISLAGSNHFMVTNVQNPPGAVPDNNPQTMPQQFSISEIVKLSSRVLGAYCAGNQEDMALLKAQQSDSPFVNVTYQSSNF